MPEVELSAGVIQYDDSGGDDPVVVLLHGVWMNGSQWRPVVDLLSADCRCVVPNLPLGAHHTPMRADADLSLRGQVAVIVELLERLDLRDVTLVFNDWCGAQLLAANENHDRVAKLVLASCETDDNYPPGLPGRMLGFAGRMPGGLAVTAALFGIRPLRRLPFTFGRMSKRPIPHEVTDDWFQPARTNPAIRRDLKKYVSDIRQGKRDLIAATKNLSAFDKPVLVIWGAEDSVMPQRSGRRLADAFPRATFTVVPDSRTLIPWDQPALLASEIRQLVAASRAGTE